MIITSWSANALSRNSAYHPKFSGSITDRITTVDWMPATQSQCLCSLHWSKGCHNAGTRGARCNSPNAGIWTYCCLISAGGKYFRRAPFCSGHVPDRLWLAPFPGLCRLARALAWVCPLLLPRLHHPHRRPCSHQPQLLLQLRHFPP